MTLVVGSYETVSLDVSPFDNSTEVTVTLYSPAGVPVALAEALEDHPDTPAGTLRVSGVAGYDEPGPWAQIWTVVGTGAGTVYRVVYVESVSVPLVLAWPPQLRELKADLRIKPGDTDEDLSLAMQLAAAIEFVEGVRGDAFNFYDESASALPDPSKTLALGTIRLAGRWQERRRTPDGMVGMADSATGFISTFDPDIDRMLGIGRYRDPVIA